jgi:hypothetical protein
LRVTNRASPTCNILVVVVNKDLPAKGGLECSHRDYMHTRSSCEAAVSGSSPSFTTPTRLIIGRRSVSNPSSPLAISTLPEPATPRRTIQLCDTITEEPTSDLLQHSLLEELESFKRHHKVRSPLTRTQSAPQLFLSITTTHPIHINRSQTLVLSMQW